MMIKHNVELSRRVGKLSGTLTFNRLTTAQRMQLFEEMSTGKAFEKLSAWARHLIERCEDERRNPSKYEDGDTAHVKR